MIELLIIIAIGILGLFSNLLTSKGPLYDNRFRWHQKLTKRGKSFLIVGILIVGLSALQYVIIESKKEKQDKLIEELQRNRPILIIRENEIVFTQKPDTAELKITLVSLQAPSRVYEINSLCLVYFKDGDSSYTNNFNILVGPTNMPQDQSMKLPLNIYTDREIAFILIGLSGKYATIDEQVNFKLRDVYRFDVEKNETSFLNEEKSNLYFEKVGL